MGHDKCIKCGREPTHVYREYLEIAVKFNAIEKDVRRFMFCKECIKEIRLLPFFDMLKVIVGEKTD